MRILWSSEIAHQMLNRMERVQQSMQECRNQSAVAYQALDEANVEGDDTALLKAIQRFEECVGRMNSFANSLDDFITAIRKTDELFCETETAIVRMAENVEKSGSNLIDMAAEHDHYIGWNPDGFATMPGMRLNAVEVPKWLNDIADSSDLISFMK